MATLTLTLPPASFALPATFTAPPPPNVRTLAQFGPGHRRFLFPIVEAAEDDAKSPNRAGSEKSSAQRDTGDRKKFVKLEEEDLQEDWYEFLKLPHGEGSTEDQIRTAYRKRCLETHPDKQPDGSDVEFKKVQRAFEILGNAEARRSYDSSRPFDDSIPSAEVDDKDFFEVFGPVFERNKKWSATAATPSLGDDNTNVRDVRKFYDAWLAFRSWRDFSNEVEIQEIDEGMMREEKRFYMRENQRMLDLKMKEELRRVRTLVDRAMKLDPRLRRHRDAEEAARQQQIAQRNAARDAALEAERQAKEAAAEKERRELEEKKQTAVNLKQQRQQNIKDVAEFFKAANLIDDPETNMLLPNKVRKPNIQWVLLNATPDETANFKSEILAESTEALPDGSGVPCVLKFNALLNALEERVGRNRYGEAVKKDPNAGSPASKDAPKAASGAAAPAATWTEEDNSLLRAAAAKYPGGAVDRWRRIAIMLHNKFTEEQVLEQVKVLEASWKARAPPIAEAPSAPVEDEWTAKQQKQLEQGLRELKDYKEKDKFTKVATYVEGKTAKQCFDRFKYLCAMAKK